MEVLTQESVAAAVKKCKENERYYVLVVTEYGEDINPLVDYLSQIDGVSVTCCRGNSWFKFENGSFIRMISTAYSTRGYKVDLVLCSVKLFDNDDTRNILQAAEIHNRVFWLQKNEV